MPFTLGLLKVTSLAIRVSRALLLDSVGSPLCVRATLEGCALLLFLCSLLQRLVRSVPLSPELSSQALRRHFYLPVNEREGDYCYSGWCVVCLSLPSCHLKLSLHTCLPVNEMERDCLLVKW